MMENMQLYDMELVMSVAEELVPTERFMEKHNGLVNPYRKFVRTEALDVKQAPFSSSSKIPTRMYLFEDLLILAIPNEPNGDPAKIGSMLENGDQLTLGKKLNNNRYRNKYKTFSWLDLARCSVKLTDPRVVQITFVTRQTEKSTYKQRSARILTRVEKVELWFDEKTASQVYSQLTCFIEDMMEVDMRRASSSSMGSIGDSASVGSLGGESATTDGGEMEKTRSWASRKNTLKRNGTLKSRGGTLPRGSGASSPGDNESVGGLSLSDLEQRYQLNLEAPPLPNGSVEFIVEFGEGKMGFSLSSGPSVGVIVGKIAENSFSDEAGVCVGDRVVEIGDDAVALDTSWQSVVEMISARPRPLRIKFERFAGRAIVPSNDSPTKKGNAKGGRATERKRQWALRRAARAHDDQSDGDRLTSLSEVEKLYKSGKTAEQRDAYDSISKLFQEIRKVSTDEDHLSACSVLEEIWVTERAYVQDLRTLIREFIIPLRRKVKRVKCKDTEGSRICEHNLLRSQCSKTSVTAQSLLSNEDMRIIFINCETIVKINTELLTFLEKELMKMSKAIGAKKKPSVSEVASLYGPAFQKIMPFFRLYALYCHSYPVGIDLLLQRRVGSKELNDVLTDRERKAKVSLNSLLIKPVQRICKYPLLFREVIKHTSKLSDVSEEHIQELERTQEVVDEIAKSVNEIVGAQESHETLMDIYSELGGETAVPWLIEPSRKFVTKVNVLMHEAPYNLDAKLFTMYVCNDIIILGKSKEAAKFETGSKTGGNAGKSRAMSLKRSFGNSLKKGQKSLRNSVRGSTGHRSGHRSGTLGKQVVKVAKTIELKSVTATSIDEPDPAGCYGIEIKYVERVMESPGKKNGTGKQVTNICKIRIWLPTKDEQLGVFTDIQTHVNTQKTQAEAHKNAQKKHGTPKASRNWKTKSTGRRSQAASLRKTMGRSKK